MFCSLGSNSLGSNGTTHECVYVCGCGVDHWSDKCWSVEALVCVCLTLEQTAAGDEPVARNKLTSKGCWSSLSPTPPGPTYSSLLIVTLYWNGVNTSSILQPLLTIPSVLLEVDQTVLLYPHRRSSWHGETHVSGLCEVQLVHTYSTYWDPLELVTKWPGRLVEMANSVRNCLRHQVQQNRPYSDLYHFCFTLCHIVLAAIRLISIHVCTCMACDWSHGYILLGARSGIEWLFVLMMANIQFITLRTFRR